MSIELVHSQPAQPLQVRLMRMQMDALALRKLSPADIRAAYHLIERTRDALSDILDRADGKHA